MEKKEKRELIKIVLIASLLVVFGVSIAFTNFISKNIEYVMNKIFKVKVSAELVVHFIDVGQGDAIAIQLPNSKIMLIDCGTKDSQNYYIKYLKDNVFVDKNNMVVDYLVFTHSDLDHIGGGCAVLSQFEVVNIYRPNIASNNEDSSNYIMQVEGEEYEELVNMINIENAVVNTIKDGISFDVGDVKVEFYGPLYEYSTTNQLSPYIKVSYFDTSFLFTGDAYGEAQEDIIDKYGDKLNADVLKVSHHGAKNSLSEELLNKVNPKYAVISVGYNSYGHPDASTLMLLDNANIKTYRTDINDNIKLGADKNKVELAQSNIVSQQSIYWWVIASVIIVCLGMHLAVLIVKKFNKPSDLDKDSGI